MSGVAVATSAPSTMGLNLTGDVRLGSLVLNARDSYGVLWVMSDLDGWWELPDPVMPDDPRPIEQDGSFDQGGQYKYRSIDLVGAFQAADDASLQAARRRLLQAANLARQPTLLQVDEDVPKQASVRLRDKPDITVDTLKRVCKFKLPLKANDPLKYSIAVLGNPTQLGVPSGGRTYNLVYNRVYGASGNPGAVVINNLGDTSAPGTITFAGPVQSPAVESVENGAHLTVNATLVVGDRLVIDLSDYSIVLNGTVDYRGYLSYDSNWFRMLPGINTLRFTGIQQIPANPPTVPYATMTVNARSAWIE